MNPELPLTSIIGFYRLYELWCAREIRSCHAVKNNLHAFITLPLTFFLFSELKTIVTSFSGWDAAFNAYKNMP